MVGAGKEPPLKGAPSLLIHFAGGLFPRPPPDGFPVVLGAFGGRPPPLVPFPPPDPPEPLPPPPPFPPLLPLPIVMPPCFLSSPVGARGEYGALERGLPGGTSWVADCRAGSDRVENAAQLPTAAVTGAIDH